MIWILISIQSPILILNIINIKSYQCRHIAPLVSMVMGMQNENCYCTILHKRESRWILHIRPTIWRIIGTKIKFFSWLRSSIFLWIIWLIPISQKFINWEDIRSNFEISLQSTNCIIMLMLLYYLQMNLIYLYLYADTCILLRFLTDYYCKWMLLVASSCLSPLLAKGEYVQPRKIFELIVILRLSIISICCNIDSLLY